MFFRLPFRIQVFISVNAPYEFRSVEERLAALQPVITSVGVFAFCCRGVKQGARLRRAFQPFTEAPASAVKRRLQKKMVERGAAAFIP